MKTLESLFDWTIVEKSIGIKWWQKILLFFCKPNYGYDWGSKDNKTIVVIKKLFGKYYVVSLNRGSKK